MAQVGVVLAAASAGHLVFFKSASNHEEVKSIFRQSTIKQPSKSLPTSIYHLYLIKTHKGVKLMSRKMKCKTLSNQPLNSLSCLELSDREAESLQGGIQPSQPALVAIPPKIWALVLLFANPFA